MRNKRRQVIDDLEKKYRALKDGLQEARRAIENEFEAVKDPILQDGFIQSGWRTLDASLSEAEKTWLLARTEFFIHEAKALSVLIPPKTDSNVWQNKGDSQLLTEQGVDEIEHAIHKEKRERFAAWRSTIAIFASLIALFISLAAYWHTLQKDTPPSTQTGNKTAPTGQPPSPGGRCPTHRSSHPPELSK